MRRILFFILLLVTNFFFACSVKPVFAQTDWVISDFQSDIAIQTTGTVFIKETLQVDFKTGEKHGIYRDIPIVYEDENNQKTYTKIEVTAVTQDDQKAQYKIINNENNLRIRIGDPNRTISGKHTYTITYYATGVLRSFTDHDELYWNVTGNEWEAPIEKANATVTVPQDKIEKTTCFEGISEATNACLITSQTPTAVTFTNANSLSPSQGMTIVVGYTKGMVPILTAPPSKLISIFEDMVTPASLITLSLTLIIGIGLILWMWVRNGRDFWFRVPSLLDPHAKSEKKPIGSHETTVVEFEPPENLRPGEIGVLMDERADTLDVTATIIDLANRGFLTITEIDKKWLFGSKDYELHKTGTVQTKLLSYEKLLLDKLFATGDTVKISALKTKFYEDLADVKKELYKNVIDKKLFVEQPETTRRMYLGWGIGMVVLGIFLLPEVSIFNSLPPGPIVMMACGIIISGIFMMITSRFMSRRSALGHELYQRSKGYLLFIGGAEKYRQQFYEKKNMFNEILPYAIIFGLTEKFAHAMKDMGVTSQNPTWYTGTHPFTPIVFASSLNSFSRSLSTAIASTPSKSGGFSGGSSGGGFGGGGGGSW